MEQSMALSDLTYCNLIRETPLPSDLEGGKVVFGTTGDEGSIYVFHSTELTVSEKFKVRQYCKPYNYGNIQFKKCETDELNELSSFDTANSTQLDSTSAEDMFDVMFKAAAAMGASDIHIYSDKRNPRILFRINGELEKYNPTEFLVSAVGLNGLISCVYKSKTDNTSSNKGGHEPAKTQTASVNELWADDGDEYRLRYQDALLNGEKENVHVTLRLLNLDKNFENTTLIDLGYELDQQQMIHDAMVKGSGGLIIIVGATGGGKTTSAATILGKIAKDTAGSKHIVTVESPVEFQVPGVNHTQVQKVDKETEEEAWERHLKALLRRDPDFILQGEMRNESEAKNAVHSALTGHVTMVTLHGNSAFDALHRCKEMGISWSLLSAAGFLKGVIYQTLLPKLCQNCSVRYQDYEDKGEVAKLVSEGYISNMALGRLTEGYGTFLENVRFRNRDGCKYCHKGVSGRTAVVEILLPDFTIREHIAKGETDKAMQKWIEARGISSVMNSELPLENHYHQHSVGFTAFNHGIKKMLYGEVSPIDVEDKLELLSFSEVLSDGTIMGNEVGTVMGKTEDWPDA
jgi:type II secretory ATPase GspE/PulE/Tfp pilus assembly ATPase PilB-like protein